MQFHYDTEAAQLQRELTACLALLESSVTDIWPEGDSGGTTLDTAMATLVGDLDDVFHLDDVCHSGG